VNSHKIFAKKWPNFYITGVYLRLLRLSQWQELSYSDGTCSNLVRGNTNSGY